MFVMEWIGFYIYSFYTLGKVLDNDVVIGSFQNHEASCWNKTE